MFFKLYEGDDLIVLRADVMNGNLTYITDQGLLLIPSVNDHVFPVSIRGMMSYEREIE